MGVTSVKRSPLRRTKGLKPHSVKGKAEAVRRMELRARLAEQGNGLCSICGQLPDFRGLQMHHFKHLSQGGITDESNCKLICARCHDKQHGIKEVSGDTGT